MLTIIVPASDFFDEASNKFIVTEETELKLEHSLVSLSKWESEYEKPFLGTADKTTEETIGYVRAMTLNEKPVDPLVYMRLTRENIEAINKHINAKMTATWFREEQKKPGPQEIITSEVIYHWLVSLQIPFEVENWHLNRLFTLVRVANEKNAAASGKKKPTMSRAELAQRNRDLNRQRQQQMKTSG